MGLMKKYQSIILTNYHIETRYAEMLQSMLVTFIGFGMACTRTRDRNIAKFPVESQHQERHDQLQHLLEP